MDTKRITKVLIDCGHLEDKKGKPCKGKGCREPLGKLTLPSGNRHPGVHYGFRKCRKSNSLTERTWADHKVSLTKAACSAWLSCGNLSVQPEADDQAQLVGLTEKIGKDVPHAIQAHHRIKQHEIKLTGQCETDATALQVVRLKSGRLLHIRAFGMSRRGDRGRTVVYLLPSYTSAAGRKTRPESIAETEPLIDKHTGEDVVVWHTDGARCYRRLKV